MFDIEQSIHFHFDALEQTILTGSPEIKKNKKEHY